MRGAVYPLQTMGELFAERVDRSGGPDACWIWTGNTIRGYGRLHVHGMYFRATRVAMFLETGFWPPEAMFVCHSCDNPPCVNPAHLWLGTPKDNTDDKMRKGRWGGRTGKRKTHCKHGHELSEENRFVASTGQERCRPCYERYITDLRESRRAARTAQYHGRAI